MSIVKSLAVSNGDVFYIRHNTDNFSVIDCSLPDDRKDKILKEIAEQRDGKGICRFIPTHPDQDHILGLVGYDDRFSIVNFYVVKNKATKSEETEDFKRYKSLRDHFTDAYNGRKKAVAPTTYRQSSVTASQPEPVCCGWAILKPNSWRRLRTS